MALLPDKTAPGNRLLGVRWSTQLVMLLASAVVLTALVAFAVFQLAGRS